MPGRHTVMVDIARGYRIAWDLPAGTAGDPPHLAGRAALAARYLSDRRASSTAQLVTAAGWTQRSTLRPDQSRFSYWAPSIPDGLLDSLALAAARRPTEPVLDQLRRDQLALAGRLRNDPFRGLLRALHHAAWGETDCLDIHGVASSLAAVDGDALGDYLDTGLAGLRRLIVDGDTVIDKLRWAPPDGAPAAAPAAAGAAVWREGTRLVQVASGQYLLAIQHRFDPETVDEVSLAVIGEQLGTADGGRLVTQLRAERGLAYSTGALWGVEHGWPVLRAYATTDREHLAECAARLAALAGDFQAYDASAWQLAGRLARIRVEAGFDSPFAVLDEHRRAALGGRTSTQVVGLLADRADRLADRPPSPLGGPARAVLGKLDTALIARLGRSW